MSDLHGGRGEGDCCVDAAMGWDGGPRWLHVKDILELRGGLGGLELAGEHHIACHLHKRIIINNVKTVEKLMFVFI